MVLHPVLVFLSLLFTINSGIVIKSLRNPDKLKYAFTPDPEFQMTYLMNPEKAISDLKNKILKVTNCYRACHNAPAMTRSATVESSSQDWADHLASSGSFSHSDSDYGENLYYGPVRNGDEPVYAWYEEESDYSYDGKATRGTGHFTQLVWKSSKDLGIGITCEDATYCYVVCNYDPPGNYLGQYDENVEPPSSASCASKC